MDAGKRLRILLLEDNADDVMLIEHALKKDNLDFVNECVDTRDEFSAAMLRFEPDVILSDHGLPGFSSREALKICQRENMSMPFILVTGTISNQNAIECLDNGADDLVLKSNLSKLPSAIRAALRKRKIEKFRNDANRVLHRRIDELRQMNTELQSMMAGSSQRLRGPLSSLSALIEAARQEKSARRLDSILDVMERCVAASDETLKSVQDYSHNLKNGILISEIDWSDQVARALKEIPLSKQDPRNRIAADLKTTVPFYSDAERISVILKAVIANAVNFRRASAESRIDISVVTNDEQAIVNVVDNGIGISRNALPKVFDMFFREAEENRGAGLGLYIAKEAARKLGGELTIRSAQNEGTTVTLMIPNRRGGLEI
jgi:signal transduction histidine kinase